MREDGLMREAAEVAEIESAEPANESTVGKLVGDVGGERTADV